MCERDADAFIGSMGEDEEEEEVEWDLRLNTVTAFIHAACLVYVDGIGSGGFKEAEGNVGRVRKMLLMGFRLAENCAGLTN